MSLLFSPIAFGPLGLANRIIIAPMCQYSAENGCATDWHIIHLGTLSQSGAGMLILEATAVLPEGRITYADLGLYDDACEEALANVLKSVRRWSSMPLGIQLAHAGRKASTDLPWHGGQSLPIHHAHGWPVVAPSAIPYNEDSATPKALDTQDIAHIVTAFVNSAQRADALGFDLIEIHAAHGYLLHQFLSPLTNIRRDTYGGSLENRMRLTLEIFEAVRKNVSNKCAIGVRISATDWVEDGFSVNEAAILAKELEFRGVDYLHISSGGLTARQQIPIGPGYQVPIASAIRANVRVPVIAVGLITTPHQAQSVLADGHADAVALARTMLYNPRWPWHAAEKLQGTIRPAPQYLRAEPRAHRGIFRT